MRLIFNLNFLIVLFFLSVLGANTSHAKRFFRGFSFKGNPIAYKSKNKVFSAGFSVIGAQGTMGNGLDDAPNRDLFFTQVQFFLGFRVSRIRLAAQAEYLQGSQKTDATQVANTNTSGTGLAYGPRLDYYDGKQSFGVFYRALHTYRLAKPDVNNETQQYKSNSGFTIQYSRRLKGRLGFVIDFTQETFTDSLATKNVSWNRYGAGLIYSNFDF